MRFLGRRREVAKTFVRMTLSGWWMKMKGEGGIPRMMEQGGCHDPFQVFCEFGIWMGLETLLTGMWR